MSMTDIDVYEAFIRKRSGVSARIVSIRYPDSDVTAVFRLGELQAVRKQQTLYLNVLGVRDGWFYLLREWATHLNAIHCYAIKSPQSLRALIPNDKSRFVPGRDS